MLKKEISYVDFLGVERKETFYFNLTESELTEMELKVSGGFASYLKRIVEAKSTPELIEVFKKIIINSYGEISEDGRRFIKSKELSENFSHSAAYDALFMELSTNAEAASDFINGIVPSRISKQLVEKETEVK